MKFRNFKFLFKRFYFNFFSIANGFVSSKIYDKRDDFNFDIVNFPFLHGEVPRRASYGVFISQLIRFARVCNQVANLNARNKCLTAKLLQQAIGIINFEKHFINFIADTMKSFPNLMSG